MKTMINRVMEVNKNLGQKANIENEIKYMGRAHDDFNIVINNQKHKKTDDFVYLRGNLSLKGGCISYLKSQIGTMRAAFQTLEIVWSASDITTTTKLQIYETLVLNCFLYNSET